MFRTLSKTLLRLSKLAKSTGTPGKTRRTTLALESLERRDTPAAINFQGGAVLTHVEVQPIFYGPDWETPALLSQAFQLSSFLGNIVNSSYMDMMTNAGYGVGRGSTTPGVLDGDSINKNQFLTDSEIQTEIKSQIKSGNLVMPISSSGVADANRLYVVFVEPGVGVEMGNGETSKNDFLGFHSAVGFNYPVDSGGLQYIGTADAHYAVIAYPGSTLAVGGTNGTVPWLDTFDTLTMVTTHELAESVTDPNFGYKTAGWIGNVNMPETEVGDLANANTVYLNGYAVQRIADQNGLPMTPMGATSATPMDFVLRADGTFWVRNPTIFVGNAPNFVGIVGVGSNSGFVEEATGVASISDQGIDNFGQAMVDVVFANGTVSEYHAGSGNKDEPNAFVPLWQVPAVGIVQEAKAGQGVSYVLTTSGNLYEYTDWNPGTSTGNTLSAALDSSVLSIDAGTDANGVNAVAYVRTDWVRHFAYMGGRVYTVMISQPDGYERSDSANGSLIISTYVQSISAGKQGNLAYVTTSGVAWWYSQTFGTYTYLASGVSAVTAGTDTNGYLVLDMLFSNGNLSQWGQETGFWESVATGVASIGKAHDGVLDAVFSGGNASEFSNNSWSFMMNDAKTAA
jgi:hypothetical protein